MTDNKIRDFILGTALTASLMGCSPKQPKEKDQDEEKPNTEIVAEPQTAQDDPYGNIALFEASRSKIKFALALVENYYPYTYKDGTGNWTTGEGLTKLYDANKKPTYVTKNTKPVTVTESDIYKGRFLTFDILPEIQKHIKVPVDENTMIAACVLGYCIGPSGLAKSEFIKQINAGKRGAELARYLTIYRKQEGVPKRLYFFAALMSGEIQWSDLLDLRAEGCYLLSWKDIFVYNQKGQVKKDSGKFAYWNFSNVKQNLETAKKPKSTLLHLKDRNIVVQCQLAKEFVPDYIWQEVSASNAKPAVTQPKQDTIAFNVTTCNEQNDISYIAYGNGDYETALKAGKSALKLAETNKQRGAATYNIGMAYLAMEKYEKAVHYLRISNAENPTNAAKTALDEAVKKRNKKRGAYGVGFIIGAGIGYAVLRRMTKHR